jgi:hypothetical protein
LEGCSEKSGQRDSERGWVTVFKKSREVGNEMARWHGRGLSREVGDEMARWHGRGLSREVGDEMVRWHGRGLSREVMRWRDGMVEGCPEESGG